MNSTMTEAIKLHKDTPPDWYFQSLRVDVFQRFWHKSRFREVSKLIEPIGGTVLDIGCADGVFSKVIFDKSHADKFIGMDVINSSVDWANKHWKKEKNMKFIFGDAHDLKFKTGTFDAVFAMEVLEHVVNPKKVLSEIRRILKKGGYAVFLVPSDNLLFRTIWFIWLHFYPRGWVWRDTHIQTYRNNYLFKVSKKAGFKIELEKKFNFGMLDLVKVRKT